MGRGDIIGQALGDGDANRHFDVAGEAPQNVAHQLAFALVKPRALEAIEGGDREDRFLRGWRRWRIDGELGQATHVAHILCRQPHWTPMRSGYPHLDLLGSSNWTLTAN